VSGVIIAAATKKGEEDHRNIERSNFAAEYTKAATSPPLPVQTVFSQAILPAKLSATWRKTYRPLGAPSEEHLACESSSKHILKILSRAGSFGNYASFFSRLYSSNFSRNRSRSFFCK
jgi:hypothetical protein